MINYLRQWISNQIWRPVLPLELILFVTRRCNFRCKHCFIDNFDTDPAKDLPLHLVRKLASDLPNLLVVMLTGGEPYLRDDLPELVRILSIYSRPKVISTVTNGFLTEKILKTVEDILNLREFRSLLTVTLPFEGIGQDHDDNRVQDSYENTLATARGLKKLQATYPNLVLGGNMTLTQTNEKRILQTARELGSLNIFSSLSQNVCRNMTPRQANTQVDINKYHQLSEFVLNYTKAFKNSKGSILWRWHQLKERYQAAIVENTCRENSYQGIPCEAGRGIGVVYNDGSVAPCELLPADWGNIKDRSFSEIWNVPDNRRSSNLLRKEKCFCSHECFLSASLNLQMKPMASCIMWNLCNPAKSH